MDFFILKRIFILKRGSVFLSLMAAGAVAATIVATHRITQNFNVGAEISRQQAYFVGQKALSLAAILVSKNIILCSSKLNSATQREGCSAEKLTPEDPQAEAFLKKLNLDGDRVAFEPVSPATGSTFGNAVKLNRDRMLDPSSPFYGVDEITWSLRSWVDPSVGSIFNASFSRGYLCRNSVTNEIIEGSCDSLENYINANNVPVKECKDENGFIANSICDYFTAVDFDENMVFISVKVFYKQSLDRDETYENEIIDSQGTTSTETFDSERRSFLYLNAAVRRPVPNLIFSPDSRVNCSQRCETALSPDGINKNPRCVGLSDYGVGHETDPRYRASVRAVPSSLKVKNFGPGVLFDLKLKREDIENKTNDVLSQAMFAPINVDNNDHRLAPEEASYLQDKIPCYASTYYRVSVESVTCSCSLPPTPTPSLATNSQVISAQSGCNQALGGILNDDDITSLSYVTNAFQSVPFGRAFGFILGLTLPSNSSSATPVSSVGGAPPALTAQNFQSNPNCITSINPPPATPQRPASVSILPVSGQLPQPPTCASLGQFGWLALIMAGSLGPLCTP